MPIVPIEVPSFLGGVSRVSQNARAPFEMEDVLNCDLNPTRGTDKRGGTEHVAGEVAQEELGVFDRTGPANTFWTTRTPLKRCIGFIHL